MLPLFFWLHNALDIQIFNEDQALAIVLVNDRALPVNFICCEYSVPIIVEWRPVLGDPELAELLAAVSMKVVLFENFLRVFRHFNFHRVQLRLWRVECILVAGILVNESIEEPFFLGYILLLLLGHQGRLLVEKLIIPILLIQT